MACSRGHFLVIICEDTKDDHEVNITFSWNPNFLPYGGEDKSCQNGRGQQLCGKWNPDILLDGAKDNSDQDEDGRQLSSERSKCLLGQLLLDPSWTSTKSCFEVVTS